MSKNFYVRNLQGDITDLVDNAGTTVVHYDYDAWGNVLSLTDDSEEKASQENPFTYRGYYRDAETGLYYLQSRYYDSETGRFVNADTTEVLGVSTDITSQNLFTYCRNNFPNETDETGLISATVLGAIFDIALSVLATWGAVSYDVLGAGFKVLYRKMGKKAVWKIISKLRGSRLVKSALKIVCRWQGKIAKILKRYAGIVLGTISEAILSTWLGKLLSKLDRYGEFIPSLFSLGGLLAFIYDARDGCLDGRVSLIGKNKL